MQRSLGPRNPCVPQAQKKEQHKGGSRVLLAPFANKGSGLGGRLEAVASAAYRPFQSYLDHSFRRLPNSKGGKVPNALLPTLSDVPAELDAGSAASPDVVAPELALAGIPASHAELVSVIPTIPAVSEALPALPARHPAEVPRPFVDDGLPQTVIPGLPDELAWECLLRVSRNDHIAASAVSKDWHDIVQASQYWDARKEQSLQEGWLYVLLRDKRDKMTWRALDPVTQEWHKVPDMPEELVKSYGMSCVANEGKLYMIGGAGWYKPSKHDVWCLDATDASWKRVADLNDSRCYCVAGVVQGDMYVVGGIGDKPGRSLVTAEKYNGAENTWTHVAQLPVECEVEDSAVWKDNFMVRYLQSAQVRTGAPPAARYNAEQDEWTSEETQMAEQWKGPSVVLDGQIYMLEKEGLTLSRYEEKAKKWVPLGHFTKDLVAPPFKMLGYNGLLYIVGKGGKTITVDIAHLKSDKKDGTNEFEYKVIESPKCPTDGVVSCVVIEV